MRYRVAGVTKDNDKGVNIQNLLKRLANGYKKNEYIESWDGMTKREMLEYGEEQSEFEYQTISNVIRLEPEPDNPHDSNAIKVFMKDVSGEEHHVGYIKREDIEEVKKQIQRNDFKYINVSFTGGKYRYVEYDEVADEEFIKEEELTRGLELTLVFEQKENERLATKQISLQEDKKKVAGKNKGEQLKQVGDSMQKSGNKMMGCGCLLTLFVTIPIILFFLFL